MNEAKTFTVFSVNTMKGSLNTSIGEVDPFVTCAEEWAKAEAMVGKKYEAEGHFFGGCYLPKKLIEINPHPTDEKEGG